MSQTDVVVKQLGTVAYQQSYQNMLAFNAGRQADTVDQFWVLEHPPVYTQGVSCTEVPRNNPDHIPIVKSDRGGQITYHGPGQLIIYCLLDIKRIGIGPKRLVASIEQAIINQLLHYDLVGERSKGAPGVYVADKKIAALGLRIRKGMCYHGLSLNVDMDVSAFNEINPCGYAALQVTSLAQCGVSVALFQVADNLCERLKEEIYS